LNATYGSSMKPVINRIYMNHPGKLCLHTITTRPWPVETAAKKYAAAGIGGISVWREALAGRDLVKIGRMLGEEGLEVVSLVRGGFFPDTDAGKRRAAIEENKRALEEAAALTAPLLVLVCGADPRQSPEDYRKQIFDGILALIPHAETLGVKLGIEPLHPMYADTRSAINTLKQATDMAIRSDSDRVGVVVDVYHLWWDPNLEPEIARCGQSGKLFAFHISDWKVPTADLLNDREIMGRGCIPVPRIRKWVEAAGFRDYLEVEIFSNRYWEGDQDKYLSEIIEAYKKHS
jgi:sugar phosphate isomerase/epimerase